MPSNPLSLRLTDAYRQRVIAIRDRVEREATNRWTRLMPQDLDAEDWVAQVSALVAQAQTEATRATSGYLSAFLTSETGKRQTITLDSRAYAGLSRDGRPLAESLRSPIIGTKAALKDGRPLDEALTVGLDRAKRMAELDTLHASRQSLLDAIKVDDRFEGWQRALRGTCAACAGVATGVQHGLRFQVHPGCQCVSEPNVVKGYQNHKHAAQAIREQLDHWKSPDLATLDQAEKTWAKRLKGLMSNDAQARQVVSDAVDHNGSSEFFQRLITKYGGGRDNVVILDDAAAAADDLLSFEGGIGAQRLGGTSFISDVKAIQNADEVAGALRHEFSHSLWGETITREFKEEFRERLGRLPRSSLANRTDRLEFTNYLEAWARDDEAFCEAVRVISDPDFNPVDFSPEFRELAEWLLRVL